LTQEIDELRVLIVDNASTDNSVNVARQLAAEDRRVNLVLRSTNCGPHASFNEGVDWASADYFMVLCADDLLAPGCVARAVSVMKQHPQISFAYGTDVHAREGEALPVIYPECLKPNWRITTGRQFIEDRCRNPEHYIAAGMVLVRTAAQKRAGHYRPELPHTDDFEMLLRLACLGDVAWTPAVQGIKRMHGANRTADFLAERTRDLIERLNAIESFFTREGSSLAKASLLRKLGRRSVAERAYWCGAKDLCRGRKSAVGLLKLALSLSPAMAVLPPVNYLFRNAAPFKQIANHALGAFANRQEVPNS
jgi:glycosyltransferase involved in cell wall biosynthesis